MNRTIGIYRIISPFGKIYIGQSWNIEQRFNTYKTLNCKKQHRLYKSFLKHGIENHKFEVIETFINPDQEFLNKKEIFWINHHKMKNDNLLNIRDGGSNGKHSTFSKFLMSQSQIGNTKGKGNKGKKCSDEKSK